MEMKVGEFLEGLHEALETSEHASRSAGASLDNWLVTVASALLALPAVIGNNLEFSSRWLWALFLLAEVSLLASVILVIIRNELFARRLDLNAAHMVVVQAAIEHLKPEDHMPKPKPEWESRLDLVMAWRKQERRLSTVALSAFLAGIILLTVVLMIRTWPVAKKWGEYTAPLQVHRHRLPMLEDEEAFGSIAAPFHRSMEESI